MSANNAAYLTATKARLVVKPAPYPTPADDEVVIKNHAIAFNPVDYALQEYGPKVFPWLSLPKILGFDVAGEVVAVGQGVTRFKVGDRVAGLADGGLQEYVPLSEHLTTLVPQSTSWEQAAVLPMGVSVSTKIAVPQGYVGHGSSLSETTSQTRDGPDLGGFDEYGKLRNSARCFCGIRGDHDGITPTILTM